MNIVMDIVNRLIAIGTFLWGIPLLILLLSLAIILTIGCRGFQFTHFGYVLKNTLGNMNVKSESRSGRGISSFRAACMALCNTLGVGNIAGVALAISLGGPGALFWIWVAVLLGMIIKYSEITLGVKFRETDPETGMYYGGVMWYIKKGLDKKWHWLAGAFAGIYVIVVINVPAVQINTAVSSITAYFKLPPMLLGLLMVLVMAIVGYGGLKRISAFAGKVVPFMALAYLIIVIVVLILHIREIPETLYMIFHYAVTDVQAMAGGFGGATVAMAARHGLCRGFYSNGAGSGDSTFSHSAADVDHPVKQGMWGITEVFIDGIVLTCTGLLVLVTGAWETGLSGAPLTAKAIAIGFHNEAFGNIFVIVLIFFFAFTSAVMCLYYSELCLKYFTRNKVIIILYRFVISAWALFATNASFVERVSILWSLGDLGSACVMLLSITALVLLRKEVFSSTKEYVQSIVNHKK